MSGTNPRFVGTVSIACHNDCDAISRLVRRGHRVRAVATESAPRFVGTATFEGFTGEKVAPDIFAAGAVLDRSALARRAADFGVRNDRPAPPVAPARPAK